MKKSFSTLALGLTLLCSATNALALDVVLFVPRTITAVATGRNFNPFQDTVGASKYISRDLNPFGAILGTLLLLPFAILDQEAGTLTMNAEELKAMNYTDSEIAQFQQDMDLISALQNQKFSSEAEATEALRALNLGVVSKELLRM